MNTPGDAQANERGLVTDSRRVTPNSAFFALPGLRTNGNEYLQEALDRGAKVIISESEDLELPAGVTGVKVDDSRLALAHFAKRYHGSPDSSIRVVGVMGTNGKTTVSTLVRLDGKTGRPVGLIGTVRYHLGDREVRLSKRPRIRRFIRIAQKHARCGLFELVMEVSSHGIHQSVASLQLEVAAFPTLRGTTWITMKTWKVISVKRSSMVTMEVCRKWL